MAGKYLSLCAKESMIEQMQMINNTVFFILFFFLMIENLEFIKI